MTGTCADDSPDVITGVAVMSATSDDRQALAGIRARLKRRGLLPGGHRRRGLHLPGPHGAGRTPVPGHPHRAAAGQPGPPAPRPGGLPPRRLPHRLRPPGSHLPARPGQQGWHGPYPTSSPDAAPLIVARFTKKQCQPCPVRAACTTSGDGKRTAGFPPRELCELQVRNHAGQQDPAWHERYAVRSGIEGTVGEFAHGHGMRHCRYRGQPKARLQHVRTAIADGTERLSKLPPDEAPARRPPAAFQQYLDQHDIQQLRSWRAVS